VSDVDGRVPTQRATRHEVVRLDTLEHVFRRPPLDDYLKQLWGRRHFIVADARGRVVSGTRGVLLGAAWLVLKPVLDGVAYFLIFGVLLQTKRGVDNFLGYLIVGVFLFAYTSRCLTGGATSLLSGKSLIKGFTFPRASLPIAVVVREVVSLLPTIAAMFAIVLAIPPFEGVTWRWLIFPAVLALQTVFNTGLALIAARVVAKVPDINHVIGFLTRFWFYGSAVFFSFDRFLGHPTILMLMKLNPMFIILDMSRDVLLYGTTPEPRSWMILGAWSAVVSLGGIVFFWWGEESYGSL
jgi:teichoic acid transport system permease protein